MSEPLDEAVAAFGAVLGELVRREVKAHLAAQMAATRAEVQRVLAEEMAKLEPRLWAEEKPDAGK